MQKGFKVLGRIHSLNGDLREVTVLRQNDMFGHPIPNSYVVDFNGLRCTALYNPIVNTLYVDDVYGIIQTA